jgi:uncharacterized protein (UPF0335 family)
MARRRKSNGPDTTTPPGINVNEATFMEHFDNVSAIKAEADEINADLRNAYKAAEEAGIDRAMLKQAMKEKKMDEAKLRSRHTHITYYRQWLGLKPGEQAGFILGGQESGAAHA